MHETRAPTARRRSRNSSGIIRLTLAWLCCCPAIVATAEAAAYRFLALETVFAQPDTRQVYPRAIVVSSSRQRLQRLPQNTRQALRDYLVYQTRVKIGETVYYRLVVGNFGSLDEAKRQLKSLRRTFADAWIFQRTDAERKSLAARIKTLTERPEPATTGAAETPQDLLSRARKAFLDGNYAKTVSLANKVVATGELEQTRAALELAGIARERQGRYAQAMGLYETLLDTGPGEAVTARIEGRMEGIRTMSIEPKNRLQAAAENPDDKKWIYRGALQQFYRDDVIDRSAGESGSVNQVLVTDIDMQVLRRSANDSFLIEVDAGLIADLMDDSTESRISQASLSYTNDSFRIIGGRQHRTVKGIYGRFDGVTFVDLSRSSHQASYFAGTLARSSFDSLHTEQPLAGMNVDFNPYSWLDVSLYLVHQEVSGLTDRQAIGSEFQMRNDAGFIYGIVDYDLFYEDLNNIRFVSSYRQSRQWTFNLTLDRVNSPPLSTVNALQGQAVDSIEDLSDIHSDDQIYRLAQDRTGKSQSLYFGGVHTIDVDRQLSMDISIFELDAIPASAGVSRIPATRDTSLSVDYSIRNLYSTRDYTAFGLRLSDSDISEITSLRLRSKITGDAAISYDPRIQLDFRQSSNGVEQTIVKPSIRLRYRAGKNLSLEADFSIEHSDLDLPDFDRQTVYSLYLGYAYFF